MNEKQTETSTEPPTRDEQDAVKPDKPMIKISEVPLYRKYFMMLKVGVPLSAVQQKMMGEGVSGVDLSNPECLVENTFTEQLESEE